MLITREQFARALSQGLGRPILYAQAGKITETEAWRLNELTEHAGLLMLRKAHAAALLKWRGQPVPAPAELGV